MGRAPASKPPARQARAEPVKEGRGIREAAAQGVESGADGMDFPKQKMRFTSTHGSDRSEEGWLVLDIRNVDLEGVSQIYVSLADVRELKAKGDQQADL